MNADKLRAAAKAVEPAYIEDVFSTYLYTGNGSTQTITNGIDLSTKGGLVWVKSRTNTGGTGRHSLWDTVRGRDKTLVINTSAQDTGIGSGQGVTSFNSDGFSLGTPYYETNINGDSVVSWTFRKQAKFFDVVTWTGTGSATTISHNLGSVPGCIIVKRTDTTGDWQVYHRSVGNTKYLVLNSTAAEATSSTRWNNTTPTSTVFSIGTEATVNASGGTYVAYLFAHDAGGFGLTGSDNVISCGSYTTDGSGNATINLGYEPQFLLVKASSTTSDWYLLDTMRGMSNANPAENARLYANTSGAEASTGGTSGIVPTATGFNHVQYIAANATYIYIAIRRGPMKVPTSGTSVFSLDASSAGSSGGLLGAITASDLVINSQRDPAYNSPFVFIDRLRGVGQVNTGATTKALYSSNTNAETTVDTTSTSSTADGVNGAYLYSSAGKSSAIRTVQQGSGGSVAYNFRRAPGFFDVVCYTGTGVARTINHNLAAVPELMIVRRRSSIANWAVNSQSLTASDYLYLNSTDPQAGNTSPAIWNSTRPTSTVFSVGTSALTNENAQTFVTYLFATVAGVSKVGSYTGSGTTKQIDCGFTGGARFVLIKKTSGTGSWYCWDTARGIVAGNDPYLLLNSTAAEVTNTDYIDTYSSGFEISSTAPSEINENGGSFIFLAIS